MTRRFVLTSPTMFALSPLTACVVFLLSRFTARESVPSYRRGIASRRAPEPSVVAHASYECGLEPLPTAIFLHHDMSAPTTSYVLRGS